MEALPGKSCYTLFDNELNGPETLTGASACTEGEYSYDGTLSLLARNNHHSLGGHEHWNPGSRHVARR
jgi:hypothetical protein